jgi:hypothetical protein
MLLNGSVRAVAVTVFILTLPAFAQGLRPTGSPLDRLEPGLWQIRNASGANLGSICLGDPADLAQLQHRGVSCSREYLESAERFTTIQYSCRGIGSGLTTIRFETPRLVRIESQGLDQGTPFAIRAQARRSGDCLSAGE